MPNSKNLMAAIESDPSIMDVAKQHLTEAKKRAFEISDTGNPHGSTCHLGEQALLLLFSSAVVQGIEMQRDLQANEETK